MMWAVKCKEFWSFHANLTKTHFSSNESIKLLCQIPPGNSSYFFLLVFKEDRFSMFQCLYVRNKTFGNCIRSRSFLEIFGLSEECLRRSAKAIYI